MSTIHFGQTTTATPEQYTAGLTDVGPGRSGQTYTFTRRPDGTTEIDHVVVREGKNLEGRFLGVVLGTVGKRVLSKAFVSSVKAIEPPMRRLPPSSSGS